MMKIDFSTRFLSYCVHFCNSAKDPSPIRYQSQIFQPFRYSLRIHDLFKKRIVQELHSSDSRTKIKELLPCCISPIVKFLCEFYVTIDFFQNLFSASYHWKIVLQLCCHRKTVQKKSARMVSHPDGLCSYLLFLIIFCDV